MYDYMLLQKRDPKRPISSSYTDASSMGLQAAKQRVPFPCAESFQTSGVWGPHIGDGLFQLLAKSDMVCALQMRYKSGSRETRKNAQSGARALRSAKHWNYRACGISVSRIYILKAGIDIPI
jgi:hypothetical protein